VRRSLTLLAMIGLASCTADLPTAPSEDGMALQVALPPPPAPPTAVSATLGGGDGRFVNTDLGYWESAVYAKITFSGLLNYSGRPDGYLPGEGQLDASGVLAQNQCHLILAVKAMAPTGGTTVTAAPTCWYPARQVGSYVRHATIRGQLTLERWPGPPLSCYKGVTPCVSYTGSQSVTVEPVPGRLILTANKDSAQPRGGLTVFAAGVSAENPAQGVPMTLREWRWEGQGPIVGASYPSIVCVQYQTNACLVQVTQSGHVVLEAIVNGVVKTERIWIRVLGGDTIPNPPVDTLPTDTIPTDTLPTDTIPGGGCAPGMLPVGLASACEPPKTPIRIPSISSVNGNTILLPVMANLFNARTQGATIKGARNTRVPAERSDVLLLEVELRADTGGFIGGPVWVISSPVNGSGGHAHTTQQASTVPRPRGTFFTADADAAELRDSTGGVRDSILVSVPDSGRFRLRYRTSGIGGNEWVTVRAVGDSAARRDSLILLVSWPALIPMPRTGTAYSFVDSDNHTGGDDYNAPGVGQLLDSILAAYKAKHDSDPQAYPMTGSEFTVDAASLRNGGLYDIAWTTADTWKFPHEQHRDGLDIDVNNAAVEAAPGTMQEVCGSFFYTISGTERLRVYCQLHHNHFHVFFGPRRPSGSPR
jgi:hypothetical protein